MARLSLLLLTGLAGQSIPDGWSRVLINITHHMEKNRRLIEKSSLEVLP